ncbi:PH domain-containing protein [Streptomyces sp. AC495_CC817]|uniref:PH domain-containing protein n=1 Tax=Streptomyces sp. AC495_CC817 TaxID=2823900 RepID=UPI001C270C93|nr:PH domain-containing protein [Streptomyces sp. AC495_CC817]
MSEQHFPGASAPQAVQAPPAGSDTLADGEWHRMHPLTPLFKGGLALIIVGGLVIANLRDRVIRWFVDLFEPQAHYEDFSGGDPVDWVLANNLALVVLIGVLVLVVVLIGAFWVIWRFQQFRITGDHVEVRKGIVFRSHRRAPLDRVQGVNLTRPFPARLVGLAKLEVVGAGNDANVELEYLATTRAESVRADILRLASGARAARQAAVGGAPANAGAVAGPATVRSQISGAVGGGVNGLITGVDLADVAPESVVKIPTGRLVGSQLLAALLWVVFFGVIFLVAMGGVLFSAIVDDEPGLGFVGVGIGLGIGIPMVVAVVGITWAQISKSLRYSIAPTPDGVRITYGLLTTVTETLPPGRIFAVEVTQSLLWRPFGWWTIRINRMSGKSAAQQQSGSSQQFNIVLPVGKRADVERVLGLILPDVPAADIPLIWEHGVLGPVDGDPYRTMPARAWWRRPLSWKRHGYAVTGFGLLLRRGTVWRKLAIFPLARLQGVSLSQGPIDRAQRVSGAQAHSVQGPITGILSGLERGDALLLINEVSQAAVRAAASDHSHRWGEHAAPAAEGPLLTAPSGPAANYPPPPGYATGHPGGRGAAAVPAYPVVPPAPPVAQGVWHPPAPPAVQGGVNPVVPPAPSPAQPDPFVPPVPPAAPTAPPVAPPAPPAAPSVPPAAPSVPPAASPVPPAASPVPPAASPVPPVASPAAPLAPPVAPPASPAASPASPVAPPASPAVPPVPPASGVTPPTRRSSRRAPDSDGE